MAKLHISLNANRSDAFTLDPEMFTLVTDPDHPLYDPRVLDEPDEALVRNVMVYGVIEPVIIRKNGDKVEVVAGRGRVKAALEANRRLTAEGKQPIRVSAILKSGQDADMFGVLISENECRREDNPLTKSEKAQRLINMGKSVEEVAIAFGVKRQSVEAWLSLGDVAQPVLDAVESGEISATAASHLSKLDRKEQVQTYEAMKAEGGKVTVERAKQAAREGDTASKPKTKRMSWVNIEYELQFIKDHPPEINVEFYRGMQNALQMVLGLGCVWPPRMPHKTDDTPEQEAGAEVYGTLPDGTEIGWSGPDAPEQQTQFASRISDGRTLVYPYGEWEPLFLPPDAPLVSEQYASHSGWCKECPIADYPHVMVSIGRPGQHAKYCPRPLIQHGLLDFDKQMASGGYALDDDEYARAKELIRVPEAAEI